MLGVVYGLEDDAAFELLKWLSQRSNTKLRTTAERLVVEFGALSAPCCPTGKPMIMCSRRSISCDELPRRFAALSVPAPSGRLRHCRAGSTPAFTATETRCRTSAFTFAVDT